MSRGRPPARLTALGVVGAEASGVFASGVPDADGAVGGAGGQAVAGGVEGQAPDGVTVTLQDTAEHPGVWGHREKSPQGGGDRVAREAEGGGAAAKAEGRGGGGHNAAAPPRAKGVTPRGWGADVTAVTPVPPPCVCPPGGGDTHRSRRRGPCRGRAGASGGCGRPRRRCSTRRCRGPWRRRAPGPCGDREEVTGMR